MSDLDALDELLNDFQTSTISTTSLEHTIPPSTKKRETSVFNLDLDDDNDKPEIHQIDTLLNAFQSKPPSQPKPKPLQSTPSPQFSQKKSSVSNTNSVQSDLVKATPKPVVKSETIDWPTLKPVSKDDRSPVTKRRKETPVVAQQTHHNDIITSHSIEPVYHDEDRYIEIYDPSSEPPVEEISALSIPDFDVPDYSNSGVECCAYTGKPLGKSFMMYEGKKYSAEGLALLAKDRARKKAEPLRSFR
eukprot:TRINITY_DN3013_c0_g1_i4.p1 TRINITY_DN3013_c0_g1~~TRINITY_DN3013_c0_g1_i4.p1  ORF type:complete len:246 (-),score=58.57 TRINITY_DN3013_c0_g1_i4:107-844(-)